MQDRASVNLPEDIAALDQQAADPLATLAPEELQRTFAQLREAAAVHWSPHFGSWVVTRYADAVAVLRDPNFLADEPMRRLARFEQRGGPALRNLGAVLANVSFYTVAPRHEILRKFTTQVIQSFDTLDLRARLAERAAELLREARGAGRLDLAGSYAADLGVFAVHVLLGVPLEECKALAGIARAIAWIFDSSPRSLREFREADAAIGRLLDYFQVAVARLREAPDGGGLARIVQMSDRELRIDDRELAGYCTFFFIGGSETTITGIAHSALMLLQQDPLRQHLVQRRELIAGATRELLRLSAPFQYVTRVAVADAVLGGQAIRAGSRLTLLLGAANRDPAAFTNPDAVEPGRSGPASLAFGHGAYRCLGAGLAQVETEAALTALLDVPDLQLIPDSLRWEGRTRVPGLAQALARFDAASLREDPRP